MKEIERKYLLNFSPIEYDISKSILIGQYYLGSKDLDIRVRYELPISNFRDRAAEGPPVFTLTIKSSEQGEVRTEHTLFLSHKKGLELTTSPLITSFISKIREFYNVPDIKGRVTIDHFSSEFKSKVTSLIEIEFESEEVSKNFNKKHYSWIGKEVTNDPFYRNINLANRI